jgi:predicted transposase/invertase (TIGR01784 family)
MFKANSFDGIEIASEKTRIFIIELPKIDLKKATTKDMFMVWMFFLKNPELIPDEFIKKVPEVHETLEELKAMSMNKEFRTAYNAHIKAQNDRISREANAEAKGEARGKAEGIAEGKAKGIAEGKAEGELQAKKETARHGIAMGLTADQISKLTGLPIEEIEMLKRL